jgi:hypothetical protein
VFRNTVCMQYRCEATTLEGFIQQLAVCYVGRGYWHYVTGRVPEGKDPAAIDWKLVQKYGLAVHKWTRCRRKRNQGWAGMQYIRHRDFFVLLATEGRHKFFVEEAGIKDVRQVAITYGGYSVSLRGGRVHVRIAEETYKDLQAYLLELAVHRSVEKLIAEFYSVPFEPYGPVKTQLFSLLGEVNDARRRAGFKRVPKSAVWLKRRYVKPFEPVTKLGQALIAP